MENIAAKLRSGEELLDTLNREISALDDALVLRCQRLRQNHDQAKVKLIRVLLRALYEMDAAPITIHIENSRNQITGFTKTTERRSPDDIYVYLRDTPEGWPPHVYPIHFARNLPIAGFVTELIEALQQALINLNQESKQIEEGFRNLNDVIQELNMNRT